MKVKFWEEFNLPLTEARKDAYRDSEGNGDGTINVVLEVEAWAKISGLEIIDSEICEIKEIVEGSNKEVDLIEDEFLSIEEELQEYLYENWDKWI